MNTRGFSRIDTGYALSYVSLHEFVIRRVPDEQTKSFGTILVSVTGSMTPLRKRKYVDARDQRGNNRESTNKF